MKTFNYMARSSSGKKVEGVAEANSREEVISQLRSEGLILEKLAEVNVTNRELDLRIGGNKAKEKSLAIMCNQFSILMRAGLPITRTLELIANQTDDKTLAQILKDAGDDVAAGYGLASSLEKNGNGLPTTFIESVRAGEESGALEAVFARLSNYYEKTSRTKAQVKSALVYPTFVIVLAVVVVAIVMIFAVPMLTETFATMGVELPWPTRAMIACSNFWIHYWWLVFGLIAVAFIAVKLGKKNEAFRLKWSQLGILLPVIGRVNLMNAASQYAGTMSVMMAAGLPIVRAVGVTARSMDNYYMGQSLAKSLPDLESGRSLAASLATENTLPELAIEMTAVGEQTGSLESTLNVVSDYYDNEVENATSAAISILEPAIIVFLAGFVLILLLAVYLPMFAIYGEGGIGG